MSLCQLRKGSMLCSSYSILDTNHHCGMQDRSEARKLQSPSTQSGQVPPEKVPESLQFRSSMRQLGISSVHSVSQLAFQSGCRQRGRSPCLSPAAMRTTAGRQAEVQLGAQGFRTDFWELLCVLLEVLYNFCSLFLISSGLGRNTLCVPALSHCLCLESVCKHFTYGKRGGLRFLMV